MFPKEQENVMALTSAAKDLLDACARDMAERKVDRSLGLSPLAGEFAQNADEMIAVLAAGVEQASSHELTVRRGDSALFAERAQGRSLYLVLCKASTPEGVVIRLTYDMTLYVIGPGCHGFMISARAPDDEVARSRAYARRSSQRTNGEQEARKVLKLLAEDMKKLVMACADSERRYEAVLAIKQGEAEGMTLVHIATACAALDISLDGFMAEALRPMEHRTPRWRP